MYMNICGWNKKSTIKQELWLIHIDRKTSLNEIFRSVLLQENTVCLSIYFPWWDNFCSHTKANWLTTEKQTIIQNFHRVIIDLIMSIFDTVSLWLMKQLGRDEWGELFDSIHTVVWWCQVDWRIKIYSF